MAKPARAVAASIISRSSTRSPLSSAAPSRVSDRRERRYDLHQHRRHDVRQHDSHRRDERQEHCRVTDEIASPHRRHRSQRCSPPRCSRRRHRLRSPTTRDAPSFAAAMESTALPAPRSATRSPGRITRCIRRSIPRVVACSPVPNAIAGSITIVDDGSWSCASHGGATTSDPTTCAPTLARHSLQSTTGGVGHVDCRCGICVTHSRDYLIDVGIVRKVGDDRAVVVLHAL